MNDNMTFDFRTIADSIDFGYGTNYREEHTVMAGAQLHVKTAPCVIDALTRFVRTGLYGWTASDDELYLRKTTEWMRRVRNFRIRSDWIVPSYGILQAMCTSIRAFTESGDGVIIQQPVYLLYAKAIVNCGRRIVDNGLTIAKGVYRMDFSDLEEKMSCSNNKLMLLCNPHNPIMDVWDREDLLRIAALAKKHNVLVVADEIFAEHVPAPGQMTPYGNLADARDNCIVCTSLGKAFNFTGTGHSNIIIPDADIRKTYIKQRDADHYGSLNPFMRTALLAAYSEDGKAWIDALLDLGRRNQALVETFLEETAPEARICRHRAGTLLWIDYRASGIDERKLENVLRAAGVEADLGSKYGLNGTGFLRIQIGIPRHELERALERLRRVIEMETAARR
ncbi:MAG: aminotransferase class I/II-fold pyridoxal phosphate-dependent enzyme [Clostridiales Family XIII bacterium]|jgi:cystathionine beta-lyase|nr:aminotransferase class I/II-fold pyridoxal phosphate-dependent enzyme [Clostridiales Family XIII bacterium]